MFPCQTCGALIPAIGDPASTTCSHCGSEYVQGASVGDVGSVLLGIVLGTIFVAPFVWTALGRTLAKKATRRAAKTGYAYARRGKAAVEAELKRRRK